MFVMHIRLDSCMVPMNDH